MIPHAYVPSRSAKYFIADTNGQTMNSFQKPVLSLEIGSLNSVQPESSKATDTSDRITQCCFFNLLPPTITIHFFLILYAFFHSQTVSYHKICRLLYLNSVSVLNVLNKDKVISYFIMPITFTLLNILTTHTYS